MGQYQKIMVVVNPAMRESTALVRGVELANRSGAALHLLLADYNPALFRARFLDPATMQDAIRGYLEVRQQWLDGEVQKLRTEGLEASGTAIWHKPVYEEIAHHALQQSPDLVIKDTDETSGLQGVFSHADWHLMRLCPVPLMLVSSHSSTAPQKILAAIDPYDLHGKPAELNDVILEASLTMAYQSDAEVHVAHAFEFIPAAAPVGAESVFADQGLAEETRKEHEQVLREFCDKHGIPASQSRLVEGQPATALPALAREMTADLLVLGTVGRSGLKRILMGATAEQVIGAAECDVLVVKPQGFIDDLKVELAELRDDESLPEPWRDFRRKSL
ncbi:MAG: universal stress protein [Gammaproteobacteria bacterium]|nr:universal stress protein [Gammaproteobacteria bacterium]